MDGARTGVQDRAAQPIVKRDLSLPAITSPRYPDHLMPFVGSQAEQDERFAEITEAFLVKYGYNTARAYRADLENIYRWAQQRHVDFFRLSHAQLAKYRALMRRRGYSEGTIRRRMTAFRGLRNHIAGSATPREVGCLG